MWSDTHPRLTDQLPAEYVPCRTCGANVEADEAAQAYTDDHGDFYICGRCETVNWEAMMDADDDGGPDCDTFGTPL